MLDLDATPCCPAYGCGGDLRNKGPGLYACDDCGRIVEWDEDTRPTWASVARYCSDDVPAEWYARLVAEVVDLQTRPDQLALEAQVEEARIDARAAREELRRLKCELSVRWP